MIVERTGVGTRAVSHVGSSLGAVALYKLPNGRWAEHAPTHCPLGHLLGPSQVSVGWDSLCERPHRTWTCVACGSVIHQSLGLSGERGKTP